MAADVAGYSRLMGEDEAGTLALLNRYFRNWFSPCVSRYGGRVVKLMGDGALVEFASVVDAVSCAIAIQQPEDDWPGLALRIGINLGDIIRQGDDIHGDGVNIAARLESLARPGGLCVSSVVNESIGSRIGLKLLDGGEVQVKNIDRPLRVWHWHPAENVAPPRPTAAPAATPAASIAVLPFDNLSGDPEQEYFSDGISEDIITDLSKLPGFLVIARNSSFTYRGRAVDIRTVGRELGVGAVLEGSVRRAGNRVRVNAQLIDARDGSHLWAERYDRELTDVFEVQDEVTRRIVEALKVQLSPDEVATLTASAPIPPEAYDLCLQARGLLLAPNLTPERCRQSIECAERAVELAPDAGPPHCWLSMSRWFGMLGNWSGEDQSAAMEEVFQHAKKAIEIEPNNHESLQAYAIAARAKGDLKTARSAVEKALKLNPNFASGLLTRGNIALYTGHTVEAIPDYERAIRLDPFFSHQYLHFLGMSHLLLGHDETAETIFRERLIQTPDSDVSRAMLVSALGHLGRKEEARQVYRDLLAINPDYSWPKHLKRFPLSEKGDFSRIGEGLAKAGVPA